MAFACSLRAQTITISADRQAICFGRTNNFTAIISNSGPATTYQWQVNGVNVSSTGPTFSSSTLSVGDKIMCVIDNTGNAAKPTASSNILFMAAGNNNIPQISVLQTAGANCQATFKATAINTGPMESYQWKLNGTITGTNSPTYVDNNPVDGDLVSCTVISTMTCASDNSATAQVKLTMPVRDVRVDLTPDKVDDLCEKGNLVSFHITASLPSSAYHYELFKNDVLQDGANDFHTGAGFNVAEGDVIYALVYNPNPCDGPPVIKSNVIVIPPTAKVPKVTIEVDKNNVCYGTPITFKAIETPLTSPVYQWILNSIAVPGATSETFTRSNFNDGDKVACKVYNANGCTTPITTASIMLTIYSPPVISLPVRLFVERGKSIQLKPTITGDAATYQWSPATALSNPGIADPVANPVVNTTYQLIATSSKGCVSAPASVEVFVYDHTQFANTFTPNGDGINDTWDIPALADYPDCTVDVYNRFGQIIFHSASYPKPWDGTRNGKPLPAGTYFYIIDTKSTLGGRQTGWVTILR